MNILDMDSSYDEFTDAKEQIDKQLVYQNKPVHTKWMGISGDLGTNCHKSKKLQSKAIN